MKKTIVIIVILVAAVLLYTMRDKFPTEEARTSQVSENGLFRPDPSSATFAFDDGPITLSMGRNEGASGEETILLNKFAYGDINADGYDDAVIGVHDADSADLAATSGGEAYVFLGPSFGAIVFLEALILSPMISILFLLF